MPTTCTHQVEVHPPPAPTRARCTTTSSSHQPCMAAPPSTYQDKEQPDHAKAPEGGSGAVGQCDRDDACRQAGKQAARDDVGRPAGRRAGGRAGSPEVQCRAAPHTALASRATLNSLAAAGWGWEGGA